MWKLAVLETLIPYLGSNTGFGSAIIERNPSFSTLNSDDINYFKGILGEKNVIQDEDMWTR